MANSGRPLKFDTPEQLQQAIDEYFGKTKQEEYSVTGLAMVIGSKQLLDDYQKRDGYSDIVKWAKLMVENAYELSLRKSGRTGDIFALKNFGWTDKQEIDQKTTIEDKRIDASKLTDDELRILAEIQRKSGISQEKP